MKIYLLCLILATSTISYTANLIHNDAGSDLVVVTGGTKTSIPAGDYTKSVTPYYNFMEISYTAPIGSGQVKQVNEFSFSLPSSLKQENIAFIRVYKQGYDLYADFSATAGHTSVNNVKGKRIVSD